MFLRAGTILQPKAKQSIGGTGVKRSMCVCTSSPKKFGKYMEMLYDFLEKLEKMT